MSRLFALALAVAWTAPAIASDTIPLGPPVATLKQVQQHPSDEKVFGKFLRGKIREIGRLSDENLDAAEQKLNELSAAIDMVELADKAKDAQEKARLTIRLYRDDFQLQRLTLADAEKALLEAPDDAAAFRRWSNKVGGEVGGTAYSRPDEAENRFAAAKAFIAKVREAAKEQATKKNIEELTAEDGLFSQLKSAIDKGREYSALVGKDAAPLVAKAWVNGTPLTDADLKGKVVLLDFWAIWCGPCINTFPHLREWNAKYADKGLVMIGMTSFYEYKWDDAEGYCARAAKDEEITPEQELSMLEKFANYYQLKHRFAVNERDNRELAEYYGVSGIPHVVVIDRQGKVRMIRVGSGKQNAEDIGNLLAELLK
jgi:Thiol-disulfide isomerase and thioredoxins